MAASAESVYGFTTATLLSLGVVRGIVRDRATDGYYLVIDLVPVRNGVRTNRRYQVIFSADDTRESPNDQKRITSVRTLGEAHAVLNSIVAA